VNDLAVLLTALLVVSSADSSERDHSEPGAETVRIVNMQFAPADLVVKRGSRIVWVNDDLFPHTVTATDAAFDSGSIAASSSWTYEATRPGTYTYVCGLHPTMKGRLIVQ
jgi:plastocyanin